LKSGEAWISELIAAIGKNNVFKLDVVVPAVISLSIALLSVHQMQRFGSSDLPCLVTPISFEIVNTLYRICNLK